ncbi:MAG: hypothetical protein IPP47_05895 [Bryobacterales bacterium]|nr:hypothetical protein [Bryobacterales bacterium]
MDPLENDFREALSREPAPDWFAERVMARVREQKPQPKQSLGWLRWAAAVAMVVVVIGGVRFDQVRRERLAGEQAKQQLMLALQVTGSKLHMAQVRVQSIDRPRPE